MSNRTKTIEDAQECLTRAEEGLEDAQRYVKYAESMPEACECDLRDWCDYVPGICTHYRIDPEVDGQCVICQHLRECHTGQNKEKQE